MKNFFITLLILLNITMASCNKETYILLTTEFGEMKIKLHDETPQHRDNFIKLVEEGYFDGLLFHRVISEFMIQGGDPQSRGASAQTPLGSGGPGYTIPAEFNQNLIHKKGSLSAARTSDQINPKKASSGSQFYIVQGKIVSDQELNQMESRLGIKYTEEQRNAYKTLGGTPFLDMNYTVFGEVVEGLDVIDKIAAVRTNSSDRPLNDVIMQMKVIK